MPCPPITGRNLLSGCVDYYDQQHGAKKILPRPPPGKPPIKRERGNAQKAGTPQKPKNGVSPPPSPQAKEILQQLLEVLRQEEKGDWPVLSEMDDQDPDDEGETLISFSEKDEESQTE